MFGISDLGLRKITPIAESHMQTGLPEVYDDVVGLLRDSLYGACHRVYCWLCLFPHDHAGTGLDTHSGQLNKNMRSRGETGQRLRRGYLG